MTTLLLNGSRIYFEVDLGLLLLLSVLVTLALVGAVTASMAAVYRMGERVAPQEQRHLVGGLEGQCAAKDAVIEQQFKLLSRQAEKIGSARGARKHLHAVGL